MGFALMVVAPFVLTVLTVGAAAKVTGGVASPVEIALYVVTVLGLAIGVAAVVWAILYFALVRKARPDWGAPFLAGLVVAGLVFIGGASLYSGIAADRNAQEEIAAAEIRQTIDTFLRDSLRAEFKSSKPRARGAYGAREGAFKADMAEAMRLSRAYRAEIKALGLAEGAPADPTAEDVKTFEGRFETGKALTVAYRAALKKRLTSARTRFEGDAFNPGVRRVHLPRFEEQFRMKQAALDRALDLEEDILDAKRQQMHILVAAQGRWTARGRMINFQDSADREAFGEVNSRLQYLFWRSERGAFDEAQDYTEFQKQVDVAGVRP